ncbi:MAG: amidohydrolase family protein [Chloroflexi bacterium]|nr:amidohydrolase family protein [Chloroflexota bacterium]
MPSTLIYNIGAIVSGDLRVPLIEADSVYVEDGLIHEVGTDRADADTIIDANGLTLTPGLVDGHTHPVFGDYSPTQNSVGWMHTYLHGGTTTIISAGELHLPGLPLDRPDPKLFRDLAILVRRCTSTYRPGGLKIVGGTMLLTPGMTEADFDVLADEGCRVVKFIFFPYDRAIEEGAAYTQWAKARGLTVKIHSGGVSRSGLSVPAGAEVVKALQPDVVGHISGGPIPMSLGDMEALVQDADGYLEIAYAGNPRWSVRVLELLRERNAIGRVTVGTDTPSGTGTVPRGMLRTILLMSSLGGVPAAEALCLATGNTAQAHGITSGLVRPGYPADLLLMGHITGSNGSDALEAIALGDLPGISTVLVDGEIVVRERSQQTPPPERLARIVKER